MNDKDTEEFERWYGKLSSEKLTAFDDVWQAACEYKQSEIDKLEKELAVAVESLEFIETGCLVQPDGGSPDLMDAVKQARGALEKIRRGFLET